MYRWNVVKTISALALTLGLVACDGGDGDETTPGAPASDTSAPGTAPATNATSSTQLGGNLQTAILSGVGQVTLNEMDAKAGPSVMLSKTQDVESADNFATASHELDIESGTDYEFEIATTLPPAAEMTVELTVPAELKAQVTAGKFLGLYFETQADEDQEGTYIPVDSEYDLTTNKITAQIPALAFSIPGDDDKQYKARVKIGVISESSRKVAASSMTLPPSGVASTATSTDKILCPLAEGEDCIEVSIYGARKRKGAGMNQPHYGMDLRAEMEDEFRAALAGKVIGLGARTFKACKVTKESPCSNLTAGAEIITKGGVKGFYNAFNSILINSGNKTLKYLHASEVKVKVGDVVTEGQVLGLAGNTGLSLTAGSHLHLVMVAPGAAMCLKQSGNTTNPTKCYDAERYTDPFPYLVNSTKIVSADNQTTASTGGQFKLALEAYDKKGTKVRSEIDNTKGESEQGQLRTVNWSVNDKTILDAKPSETLTETAGFPYKLSSNPTLRNQATIKVLQEATATIAANWQGLSSEMQVRYEAKVEGFWTGVATITSCVGTNIAQPYRSGCNILSFNINVGNSAQIAFRTTNEELNLRLDQEYGCMGASTPLSGAKVGSVFGFSHYSQAPFGNLGTGANYEFTIESMGQDSISGTFKGDFALRWYNGQNGSAAVAGYWSVKKAKTSFPKCLRPGNTPLSFNTTSFFCPVSSGGDYGCDYQPVQNPGRDREWQ